MDAIIGYLDLESVTVDDDLQTALDTYEADPSEDNFTALVKVWDDWTYGRTRRRKRLLYGLFPES